MGRSQMRKDYRSGIWQCDEMVFGLTGGLAARPLSLSPVSDTDDEIPAVQETRLLHGFRLAAVRTSERASNFAASLAQVLKRWADQERDRLTGAQFRGKLG